MISEKFEPWERKEHMPSLNDLTDALWKTERMMNALTELHPLDSENGRFMKEQQRYALAETIQRVADDLAEHIAEVASYRPEPPREPPANFRASGSRRN
jgi:hypothetical protein